MAQKTYAGITVDVNEEGYFTNPSQWTKEIAVEIAESSGGLLGLKSVGDEEAQFLSLSMIKDPSTP